MRKVNLAPGVCAAGLVSGDHTGASASSSFMDVGDFQSNGNERTQHNLQRSKEGLVKQTASIMRHI